MQHRVRISTCEEAKKCLTIKVDLKRKTSKAGTDDMCYKLSINDQENRALHVETTSTPEAENCSNRPTCLLQRAAPSTTHFPEKYSPTKVHSDKGHGLTPPPPPLGGGEALCRC